jgi:hypothetical protein
VLDKKCRGYRSCLFGKDADPAIRRQNAPGGACPSPQPSPEGEGASNSASAAHASPPEGEGASNSASAAHASPPEGEGASNSASAAIVPWRHPRPPWQMSKKPLLVRGGGGVVVATPVTRSSHHFSFAGLHQRVVGHRLNSHQRTQRHLVTHSVVADGGFERGADEGHAHWQRAPGYSRPQRNLVRPGVSSNETPATRFRCLINSFGCGAMAGSSIDDRQLGGDSPELGDCGRSDTATAQGHTAQSCHRLENFQASIGHLRILEVQPLEPGHSREMSHARVRNLSADQEECIGIRLHAESSEIGV